MKKLIMIAACAAVAMFAGCRSVKVENYGEEVLKNADGAPILVDGKVVKCSKGWSVKQLSHWMNSEMDALDAGVKGYDGSEIRFTMNGMKSSPSEEFVKSLMTFAYVARVAASMYSPGAATVPLAPEAADPDAVAKLVEAQAAAKASEIAAKSARQTALIKAQSDASIAEKKAAQQSAAAGNRSDCTDCTDGSCPVK